MPRGISRHRAAEHQTTLILDSRTKDALAADANDYDLAIGACFNLSTSGGARSITGIAGGVEGRVIQLVNVGTDYIYLVNESTGSLAPDRILTALSNGATFNLAPNMSVFLSYNNVVGRWLVLHSSVVFDPEVDTPLNTMLGGVRNFVRSGGMMTNSRFLQLLGTQQGFLKLGGFATKTNGPVSQSFGTVTGLQVSFTMPKTGSAVIVVSGAADNSPGTTSSVTADIGARFDSDTAQKLNGMYSGSGAGGDLAIATQPLFGLWAKSGLASGAHTADFCFGGGGNWNLLANSTYPAMIAVFHEA